MARVTAAVSWETILTLSQKKGRMASPEHSFVRNWFMANGDNDTDAFLRLQTGNQIHAYSPYPIRDSSGRDVSVMH